MKKKPDTGPRLQAGQARQICELYVGGETVLELAKRFQVSDKAVKDVLNFEIWSTAGGPRMSAER